jgi:hypothetical protein
LKNLLFPLTSICSKVEVLVLFPPSWTCSPLAVEPFILIFFHFEGLTCWCRESFLTCRCRGSFLTCRCGGSFLTYRCRGSF